MSAGGGDFPIPRKVGASLRVGQGVGAALLDHLGDIPSRGFAGAEVEEQRM